MVVLDLRDGPTGGKRVGLKKSLTILAVFVLVSSLAFSIWEHFSVLYLAQVAPAVNYLFALSDLPVALEQRQDLLLLVYRQADGSLLRLSALDYHVIYLNLVVGLALFAAFPARGWQWRLRWMFTLLVVLWMTHVGSFFSGAYIAIWDYISTLPHGLEKDALVEFAQVFPLERKNFYSRVLALWNAWGRYALCLAMFFSLRPETLRRFGEFNSIPLKHLGTWFAKIRTGAHNV